MEIADVAGRVKAQVVQRAAGGPVASPVQGEEMQYIVPHRDRLLAPLDLLELGPCVEWQR